MKLSVPRLQQRRQQVLQQMAALDHLRRGSLSRQFFQPSTSRPKARQGPYYILQGYFHGRKFSERVPAQEVSRLKPLVANYKRFVALAEQLVTLTDQLTRRTQGPPRAPSRPHSPPPP